MSSRLADQPPSRLIIDTDPGIDDVVTLALAARSPEVEIAGITTTYGNATLDATTRNAHELLRLVGRKEIPVHPGADRPLTRDLVTAPETHGESGVGYAAVKHPAGRSGVRTTGTRRDNAALIEAVARAKGPVTLVTLGPLTNLAQALEQDDALIRKRVTRHIGMFGSVHAVGNTNRFADFNTWCDPEAADRVLRARLPTDMVGLDVTRQMVFGSGEVEAFARSTDPLVSWLGLALRFYVQFHRQAERLDGCVVNDVLTVGELLSPGLLGFEEMTLGVDLDAGDHRGHTRVSPDGVPVRVAMKVDTRRMRELLQRVFGDIIAVQPPPITYRQPDSPRRGT
jgi:inosine-uridine nucleoside N-ribohydrolase